MTGSAFLIDMNVVFERFLRTALRDELGLPQREWPEGERERRLTLDKAGRIDLIPDLLWRSGRDGTPTFVGDAKYKRIEPVGFRHGDVYQMLAYCIASDLPSGLLIYSAEEHVPSSHQIRHVGKTIEIAALDLSGGPEAMLEEVKRISHIVHKHYARGAGSVPALSA